MSIGFPNNAQVTDESGRPSVPFLNWFSLVHATVVSARQSGTTANRPTANLWTGRTYFDTTLGKPIWYEGPGWVDATGAAV